MWPLILGGLFLFFVIAHEVDRQGAVKASAAKESFAADWNSGKISDAGAFIAHCGQPILTEQSTFGPVLHYASAGEGDYLVTVPSRIELEHPRIENGKSRSYKTSVSPEQVFTALHCR
jgi:hypothetical protein